MANIHVNYESMNQEARNLRSTQQNIEDALRQAQSKITGLVNDGFVTDSASVKFHESYETFTRSANQAISALDQIAGNLEATARALQQTDADLASRLG